MPPVSLWHHCDDYGTSHPHITALLQIAFLKRKGEAFKVLSTDILQAVMGESRGIPGSVPWLSALDRHVWAAWTAVTLLHHFCAQMGSSVIRAEERG